jgi:hypothetical protein
MNGSDTWTRVAGAGTAPFDADTGRISLAVSARAPVVIYALGATASGDARNCPDSPVDQAGVFQSVDEGATWKLKSNPVTGTCASEFQSILQRRHVVDEDIVDGSRRQQRARLSDEHRRRAIGHEAPAHGDGRRHREKIDRRRRELDESQRLAVVVRVTRGLRSRQP